MQNRNSNCSLSHIGGILNGTAGVVVCVIPSVISALWFPPGQRTTATGKLQTQFIYWKSILPQFHIKLCIPKANLFDVKMTKQIWMTYNASQNHESTLLRSTYIKLHMYWMNFWLPTVHVQQNIFEKILIEACSPHLYASFGTFCA